MSATFWWCASVGATRYWTITSTEPLGFPLAAASKSGEILPNAAPKDAVKPRTKANARKQSFILSSLTELPATCEEASPVSLSVKSLDVLSQYLVEYLRSKCACISPVSTETSFAKVYLVIANVRTYPCKKIVSLRPSVNKTPINN